MNITIRRMRPDDVDALYRLLSDPAVMRYLEPPYDRAQAEVFLHTAGLAEPSLVYAAEENGAFLGYVIYHAYDAESVEIGWVLFPESWGRGYASAARGGSRRTSCSNVSRRRRPQSGSRSKKAFTTAGSATDWRYTGYAAKIKMRGAADPCRQFAGL